MTVKKLEEYKNKFSDGKGTIQDLGEVLTDFYQTFSLHMKDIKKQNEEILINQDIIFEEIKTLHSTMNPIYSIVFDDAEDSSDSE